MDLIALLSAWYRKYNLYKLFIWMGRKIKEKYLPLINLPFFFIHHHHSFMLLFGFFSFVLFFEFTLVSFLIFFHTLRSGSFSWFLRRFCFFYYILKFNAYLFLVYVFFILLLFHYLLLYFFLQLLHYGIVSIHWNRQVDAVSI